MVKYATPTSSTLFDQMNVGVEILRREPLSGLIKIGAEGGVMSGTVAVTAVEELLGGIYCADTSSGETNAVITANNKKDTQTSRLGIFTNNFLIK